MKTYLDCIPCFLQQALRAGRLSGLDNTSIKRLLNEVSMLIPSIPMDNTPPETGALIYKKINEIVGNNDPFAEVKERNINHAKQLYPELRQKIDSSNDRLLTAIRIAVAGNVIDLGASDHFDIEADLAEILVKDFAVFDYGKFKESLKNAENILYIGDNAGETVFDKLLIEELADTGKKHITFAVREIPIINDVTVKEANWVGMHEVSEVISSGTTAPGTILSLCTNDFIDRFEKADMIISKGQGNYEGLSEVDRSVFFLLKAKCPVLASNIGVEKGDIILKVL